MAADLQRRLFTADDLDAMQRVGVFEDAARFEVIDGDVIATDTGRPDRTDAVRQPDVPIPMSWC